MKEISLKAEVRPATGKAATREMRKEGKVPCNLYGEKKADGKPVAEAISIAANELNKAIFTPDVLVCNIDVDGKVRKAVIKEVQAHPVSGAILHVDFYEVNDKKPITIGIPVNIVGHAQGVRDGGKLVPVIRKILVTAPYKDIPEKLDVDVTNLKIGKSVKVGELRYDGLTIATSKEVIVCTVKMTRAAVAQAAQEAQ
ncbi:MAG: 50S ribosomal protein L25 [Prevotella sp.]|nr:50S ribosomal protein L25 [Prevotella sp.]